MKKLIIILIVMFSLGGCSINLYNPPSEKMKSEVVKDKQHWIRDYISACDGVWNWNLIKSKLGHVERLQVISQGMSGVSSYYFREVDVTIFIDRRTNRMSHIRGRAVVYQK